MNGDDWGLEKRRNEETERGGDGGKKSPGFLPHLVGRIFVVIVLSPLKFDSFQTHWGFLTVRLVIMEL
jgi:hypothetical protein